MLGLPLAGFADAEAQLYRMRDALTPFNVAGDARF
jgi:hypothetical protein